MVAGHNLQVSFIRLNYNTDDEVGGSNPTGTVLYEAIEGRMEAQSPNTDFVGQGLETMVVYRGTFWHGLPLDVREQDEMIVTSPSNHPYYSGTFRLVTVQQNSSHPSIRGNYILCTMTRKKVAHGNPYQ